MYNGLEIKKGTIFRKIRAPVKVGFQARNIDLKNVFSELSVPQTSTHTIRYTFAFYNNGNISS